MKKLSLTAYPYSIYGSWFVAKYADGRLNIDNLHGWKGTPTLFSVKCDEQIEYTPDDFVYSRAGGHKLAFYGADDMVFSGQEPLTLHYVMKKECGAYFGNPYDALFTAVKDGAVLINDYKNDKYVYLIAKRGSLSLDAPLVVNEVTPDHVDVTVYPDRDGIYELCVINTASHDFKVPKLNFDYSSAVACIRESYSRFAKSYADIADADEAIYTMWTNYECAYGLFDYDVQICSKAGMCAIWSWDNCFSALAMARRMPERAFDEFMIPYRHLAADGYMFDSMTDEKILWSYTKPPCHGYMYELMMQENDYFSRPQQLKQLVEPMISNTMWWLTARGEPTYMHGNDSGADNATCFDKYMVITSPELYALLAVQCRLIYKILTMLSDLRADGFDRLSAELAAKINDFVVDGKLAVRSVETGEFVKSDALIVMRTLLATDMLDKSLALSIIDGLKRYECKYGLTSEPLDSPLYVTNGYWRGAIWAPDQLMFVTALNKCGQTQYARRIARKYIDALETAGFSENVDAVTGQGIRCPMYNWTAATYLYLRDFMVATE